VGPTQQQQLINYLNSGGAVYMEGADVGYSHQGTDFFNMFGATFEGNGYENTIQEIWGVDGLFAAPNTFIYPFGTDADYSIDMLGADAGIALLQSQEETGRAVLYDSGSYRTIIASPIIGAYKNGSGSSTKASLMSRYVNFLIGYDDPDIWVSAEAVEFPVQYTGYEGYYEIALENHGMEDLTIDDVQVTGNNFSCDYEPYVQLESGGQLILPVIFFADSPGNYTGNLIIISNDPNTAQIEIPLMAECLMPPVMDLSATEIEVEVEAEGEGISVLEIINSGNSDLNFILSLEENETRGSGHIQAPQYADVVIPKEMPDTRTGRTVTRGAGGPDEFGYRWIDSNEASGPEYEWLDISDLGDLSGLTSDDAAVFLDLPFTFEFYGDEKSAVLVSDNGYLTFGANGSVYYNVEIPDSNTPNDLICPFWDDLIPTGGAHYNYYDETNGRFILQWTNWGFYYGGGICTFQVQLYQNGKIMFFYEDMENPGTATVGIENAAGDDGLEIAFNTPYVESGLAVLISSGPTWVETDCDTGVVNPGMSQIITFFFNAADLHAGDTYYATCFITSNDPADPYVEIPIVLYVISTDADDDIVLRTALKGNYPNPFNPITTISFSITENVEETKLEVYNMRGQKVRTLLKEMLEPGHHTIEWNGLDDAGRSVSSGVYFYKLKAGNYTLTKKMLLLK
jgi:hypothetical protein